VNAGTQLLLLYHVPHVELDVQVDHNNFLVAAVPGCFTQSTITVKHHFSLVINTQNVSASTLVFSIIFTTCCYAMMASCPSFCLSQAKVLSKQLNINIQTMPHGIQGILIFCCQSSGLPKGAIHMIKICNFPQIICDVLKTVQDRVSLYER